MGFHWRQANVQTSLGTRKTLNVRKHRTQETQIQRTTKRKKEVKRGCNNDVNTGFYNTCDAGYVLGINCVLI